MDGLMLLRRARDAGLAVTAEGDKLVIRGPKRAEPVALLLIEHKPKVLAALVPAERAAQRWRDCCGGPGPAARDTRSDLGVHRLCCGWCQDVASDPVASGAHVVASGA